MAFKPVPPTKIFVHWLGFLYFRGTRQLANQQICIYDDVYCFDTDFLLCYARYQIISNVDRFGTIISGSDTEPSWFIALAISSGLIMHVPYVVQHEIIPCTVEDNPETIVLDCWKAVYR